VDYNKNSLDTIGSAYKGGITSFVLPFCAGLLSGVIFHLLGLVVSLARYRYGWTRL